MKITEQNIKMLIGAVVYDMTMSENKVDKLYDIFQSISTSIKQEERERMINKIRSNAYKLDFHGQYFTLRFEEADRYDEEFEGRIEELVQSLTEEDVKEEGK